MKTFKQWLSEEGEAVTVPANVTGTNVSTDVPIPKKKPTVIRRNAKTDVDKPTDK